MAFKFDQTQPNMTKLDQTAPNKVALRWTVWSPNNVLWCLFTKHFPFGQAFRLLGVDDPCLIKTTYQNYPAE